ncbi:glycerol-3-phosphate 1-O-acyltransferase PlsY [Azoarcus sp. L1K30]|uniref:glycerol-3-phosphate 1-O-acyltransferase PlsY n=1 Tax=Azoarcus sp. L1K30 TaxID=2820277 RepID=UPI001B83FBA3|nr:glycerol-3-phosphate 1-O-acyltransferase PlsY [Azoarcus sp. L1K30]MBR0566436.1 glycerol-3-phosphate 1-O-acyltransferase PlsY [Azoarcus sp. L1K30]
MSVLILLVVAYLLGSIPFALVSSRLFGLQDPRTYGSGNPGATNVLRSGNKAAAALTLIGDCVKGWIVVWVAMRLGFTVAEAALAGFAAFLGHVFTIFLRFNGGKGVATALGVLAGIDWRLALASLCAWFVVALVSRYSSAASLASAALSPIVGYVLFGADPVIAVLLAMSAVLIWRHTGNIQRLLAGTEGKLGGKKG